MPVEKANMPVLWSGKNKEGYTMTVSARYGIDARGIKSKYNQDTYYVAMLKPDGSKVPYGRPPRGGMNGTHPNPWHVSRGQPLPAWGYKGALTALGRKWMPQRWKR